MFVLKLKTLESVQTSIYTQETAATPYPTLKQRGGAAVAATLNTPAQGPPVWSLGSH